MHSSLSKCRFCRFQFANCDGRWLKPAPIQIPCLKWHCLSLHVLRKETWISKDLSNFYYHILGWLLPKVQDTWNNSKVSHHYYVANKPLFRCGRKIRLQEERSREVYCSPEIQRSPTGSLSACHCLSERMSRFFKSQAKVSISINCRETSSPCSFPTDTICVWGVIQILDCTYLAGLAPLFTDNGFVITHNEVTIILLKQRAVWHRQLLGHFIQAFWLQVFNAVSFSQNIF